MPHFIALLRGINVGGRNKLPMRDLCALCEDLGWREVRHYIQSGNIVLSASKKPPELESTLEAAIARKFELKIPVIVRTARQWDTTVSENPFQKQSSAQPNRVMLVLSKSPPLKGAEAALRERALDGERIEAAGSAIWIHFQAGQAQTKLSPSLLDRVIGSTVTARNWTTVQRISEMLSTSD